MARDRGLEALLAQDIGDLRGLTQKPMFGGLAWLLEGHLLCAVRKRGLLIRLGKDNEAWALEHPGITAMVMQDRPIAGWLNAAPEACSDDRLRRKLIAHAIEFVRSLPPQ